MALTDKVEQPLSQPDVSDLWSLTDEQLFDLWANIEEVAEKQGQEFVDTLFRVTAESRISFDIDRMTQGAKDILFESLNRNVDDGVVFTPQEGKQFVSGEKTAAIKSRPIHRLRWFHILTNKNNKALGYIRFREPELLSVAELKERVVEHAMTAEMIDEMWPGKESLYYYAVRDFIPFDKAVKTEPIEGSQVFVEDVVLQKRATKKEDRIHIKRFVEIIKADDERHFVYGEVLIPETEDGQGDVISAVEIRKAAHQYMYNSQVVGIMHKTDNPALYPVESYLAPQDFTFGSPHRLVKKGTWVLGVEIDDLEVWERVQSGELTGFSIEAYAQLGE